VKSDVETLNPTRVRLTVEVPFEELKPSMDQAYKKIASQVTIPGFRKGKVPARLIDQRFGRGIVLEEAVNEALPKLLSDAVSAHELKVLGHPELDVTEMPDPQAGGDLKFSAEVDVRPEFELPDYEGLEVTVSAADVTDTDVDGEIDRLRERFGVLNVVERPAAMDDFLSVDVSATVDGEPVADATAKGLSYRVGTESLLDGLDEAVTGLSAGETTTFSTTFVGGDYAGEPAEVEVKVNSVKERDLPEPDDDFAQTASEFDTIEELRDDLRSRLVRTRALGQRVEARDRVIDALLERVDLPLPEGVLKAEVEGRKHQLDHELDRAGLTKSDYLVGEEQTEEEFDAAVEEQARKAIKAQFILDAIAAKEQFSVGESELSQHLIGTAMSLGMAPDDYAQQVVSSGRMPLLVSEVVRGKALARLVESARVVDESGREVVLKESAADGDAEQDSAVASDADAEATEPASEADESDSHAGPAGGSGNA
jgi:trigger factor